MAEDQPTNSPADQNVDVKPTNESEEAKNTDSKSFNWKAAAIASAATVGLALIVLAIVLIVKHVRKKKEEDKDKNKNDKEAAPTVEKKPQTKILTFGEKKVVATLGEDGLYHLKRDQLKNIINKDNVKNSITSVGNSTNNSINKATQEADKYSSQISELSKKLDTTNQNLEEHKKQKEQINKIESAIDGANSNIISDMLSKMLQGFEVIPKSNTMEQTEGNLPAAPMPVEQNHTEDLMNKEEKEVKTEVTTNLETANKAKEETKGNAL